MKFSDLKIGQTAVITKIANIKNPYKTKILAMGLIPGVKIKIIKEATFGDPIMLAVNDFQLIVRRDEIKILDIDLI